MIERCKECGANLALVGTRHRCVRRMGDLLKEFDAQGRRTDQLKEGTLQKLTAREAAGAAGVSEHQRKQAVRVANVPAAQFEAAVEAEKPATRKRAPKGTFDRTKYQRELMRKRRAAAKAQN